MSTQYKRPGTFNEPASEGQKRYSNCLEGGRGHRSEHVQFRPLATATPNEVEVTTRVGVRVRDTLIEKLKGTRI